MTKSNTIWILLILFLGCISNTIAQNDLIELSSFDDDYTAPDIPFAFSGDSLRYTLSHNAPTELQVACDVPEENFTGFIQILFDNDTANAQAGAQGYMDLSNRAILSIVVRAEDPIRLRADLADTTGTPTDTLPENQEVFLTGNNEVDTIVYEFTPESFNQFQTGTDVDSTAIGSIILVVNPGGAPYDGNLFIDRMILGGLIVTTSIEKELTASLNANLFPNPGKDQLALEFNLDNASKVNVSIQDIQGKILGQQSFGTLPTGSHSKKVNIQGLSTGLYMLRMEVEGIYAHPIKFLVD